MLDLGIIIVNWNTEDYLRRCLASVMNSQGDFAFKVVVVDNASTDGSARMVREHFPEVQLITSDVNGGFSYGNNLGLRALGFQGVARVEDDAPRYVLLLNPDTLVPPESLYAMIQFMDSRADVGMAGPKLLLEDGSLDLACRRSFPTPIVAFYHFSGLAKLFPDSPHFARYNMTFEDPDKQIEVDSVVGACMQVRREAIEDVGLMDEAFFMYGEDLDWAYRIKASGWKIVYNPEVIVWHVKRAASRKSQKARLEFYRAMLIFYRKHFQTTTPRWLHALVMLGLLVKGGRGLWREIRHSPMPVTNA